MGIWFQILRYSAIGIPLLPVIVGALRFRNLSKAQKWLLLLVGYTLLNNLFSESIIYLSGTNYWIFHLYVVVDFILLNLVFSSLLTRRHLVIFSALFVIIGCLVTFLDQGWTKLPSTTMTLEAIYMVLLTFLYFWNVFKEMKILKLERQFLFWVGTTHLLYFSGNLLLFIFSNYIFVQGAIVANQIWMITVYLNLFRYGFYALALTWKDPEQPS